MGKRRRGCKTRFKPPKSSIKPVIHIKATSTPDEILEGLYEEVREGIKKTKKGVRQMSEDEITNVKVKIAKMEVALGKVSR